MSTQPEALRLADELADPNNVIFFAGREAAATELRRLHEANQELLEALLFITEDVCERFDMDSPSTNLGMKMAVRISRAAIAKHGSNT